MEYYVKLYTGIYVPCIQSIPTAQLHSTKPKLGFCAGSNPAGYVSEIRDGDDP